MDFNKINEQITVSGQITLEDLAEIKARGFKSVINNRPDEEITPDLMNEAMGAACTELGLAYRYIPVVPGGMTPDLIGAIGAALSEMDGPIFAYCRSGTRSCTVWGLAQAGQLDADEIVKQAAGAGYDLSGVAAYLAG